MCMECQLYDLAAVKNARGAVMSQWTGRCLWKSTEVWPESVSPAFHVRPTASWMQPKIIHRCPRFIKRHPGDI